MTGHATRVFDIDTSTRTDVHELLEAVVNLLPVSAAAILKLAVIDNDVVNSNAERTGFWAEDVFTWKHE